MKNYLHFDEELHKYTIRDKETDEVVKDLISATQLMEKHGLSVKYDEVPEEVMENAKLFGKTQHKWLEMYFKGEATIDEVVGVASEGIELLESEGFKAVANEHKVFNQLVAGTVDMYAYDKNNEESIVDFKFTYAYNGFSIMWQLNIYRVLFKQNLDIDITKLYCLWYNKPKQVFEIKEVPLLEDKLIFDLFDAEIEGRIYENEQFDIMAKLDKDLAVDRELAKFFEAQQYVKRMEVNVNILKEELFNEMKARGIKTYETDNFRLTLVDDSITTTIDNKRLQEDVKDIVVLSNYERTSVRKGHLRITDRREKVKEVDADE